MHLVINGEEKTIDGVKTIEDLLKTLGYEKDSVAIAHQGTFISRSKYPQYELQNGEELEILVPMQGG